MTRVEELTKRRGGRAVVSDITFRCEPRTVTGFLGPKGAGTSTTMRMLVDLSKPDSGEAQLLSGRGPPGRKRRASEVSVPPVVLVHSLWLTPRSCEGWKQRCENRASGSNPAAA